MERMRRVALCLALLVAGCEGYSVTVTNKEPLVPLPEYDEWWAATESCSERTGDMYAIQWFTALTITGDHVVARGLWTPPHQIVLVRGYEDEEVTVRHEMLHDLLAGDSDHESPLWDACGLIPS
jgi:hypothetical protein